MSKLTGANLDRISDLVRTHWPELDYLERPFAVIALNRIQALAESLGVEAVTPDSISGIREILEDYFIPVVTANLVAEEIKHTSGSDGSLQKTFK